MLTDLSTTGFLTVLLPLERQLAFSMQNIRNLEGKRREKRDFWRRWRWWWLRRGRRREEEGRGGARSFEPGHRFAGVSFREPWDNPPICTGSVCLNAPRLATWVDRLETRHSLPRTIPISYTNLKPPKLLCRHERSGWRIPPTHKKSRFTGVSLLPPPLSPVRPFLTKPPRGCGPHSHCCTRLRRQARLSSSS